MFNPLATTAHPATSSAQVLAVHCDSQHRFSKPTVEAIALDAGLGVVGDAHYGATVQHRYHKRWRPQVPNLRQVHLLSASLLDWLAAQGFALAPGALGENITLAAAPGWNWQALMDLPVGTQLHFSRGPVLVLTGWRQPCVLIDRLQPGLQAAMAPHRVSTPAPGPGHRYRIGVMATVHTGGCIRAGDAVQLQRPPPPHHPMECV